jgi:hypothetical protein
MIDEAKAKEAAKECGDDACASCKDGKDPRFASNT